MQMQNVYVFDMFPCQITGLENAKMQSVFLCLKNEAPKNEKNTNRMFWISDPPKQNAKLHIAFPSFKNLHIPMGSFSHLFHIFKYLTREQTVPDLLTSRLDLQFSLTPNMRANCG